MLVVFQKVCLKKNSPKVDGKQNYQCKLCKRQFIGDHALSYSGYHSDIKTKILHIMVRGSGIRNIAQVERVSIDKVLRTLSQSYISTMDSFNASMLFDIPPKILVG